MELIESIEAGFMQLAAQQRFIEAKLSGKIFQRRLILP
jgi:hypothetical protein